MSPDCGSKEDAGCGEFGSLGGRLGASGEDAAGVGWLGADGAGADDEAGEDGVVGEVGVVGAEPFDLPFIFIKTRAPIKTTTTIPPMIFNIQILFLFY